MTGAPIPTTAVYDDRQLTGLAVSPDGERIAFTTTEYEPDDDRARQSLWTVPADGSEDPHRLTRLANAADPSWSPDGGKLGFLAARERDLSLAVGRDDGDGPEETDVGDAEATDPVDGPEAAEGEEPDRQLWVFDLERGGDPRQVTDRDHGVREFDWGPDGERVVISAKDPTDEEAEYLAAREEDGPVEIERLQHRADGVGFTDSVDSYLFVVDLEARETRRLDDAYGGGALEPLAGLQPAWGVGERIAFCANRTERPDDSAAMDVYVVDADGGESRRVTDGSAACSDPVWSPGGDRLAYTAAEPGNPYAPAEVRVADLPAETDRSVSASLDRTVSRFSSPRWLDSESLCVAIGDEGWSRLVVCRADADEPRRVFEELGRDRSIAYLDVGGGTVGISIHDPEAGHDVHVLDGSALRSERDAEARRLTALRNRLVEDHPMPSVERLTTEGEATVESLCYVPDDVDLADGPHPTILWPHGGPASYDTPWFRFTTAFFTSRGYVICKPNYRGSTSYGRAFAETLQGRWGSVEIDDQLAVVDELLERGIADPERLFVTGFSYGGISTGFLLTRTDRFVAAAAEHGIYDLRSAYGTDDTQAWLSAEFGVPWEAPDTYEASSSITDVDEIDTPLLVTAGGQDWRCPPSQSEQLYVSVRKRGVPAKLVVYPDEHHNVGDPDRAIHRLEALVGWFERFDPAIETGDESGTDSAEP